jgi:hypothetical protein
VLGCQRVESVTPVDDSTKRGDVSAFNGAEGGDARETVGLLDTINVQDCSPARSMLLDFSNLVYQGAFRVPTSSLPISGTTAADTTTDAPIPGVLSRATFDVPAPAVLAFNPSGNGGQGSLFITGVSTYKAYYSWTSQIQTSINPIAEISIPTPVISSDLAALPVANYVQSVFFSPFSNLLPNPSIQQLAGVKNISIGGMQVIDNQLVCAANLYYFDVGGGYAGHFRINSLNFSTATVDGFFNVGTPTETAGWMCPIPSEWQTALGAPYITGLGTAFVGLDTSFGPSAFGFDPSTLSTSATANATKYVFYVLNDRTSVTQLPEGYPFRPGSLCYGTTHYVAVAFPPGTKTILFYARNGFVATSNLPGDPLAVSVYADNGETTGPTPPASGFPLAWDVNGKWVPNFTINDTVADVVDRLKTVRSTNSLGAYIYQLAAYNVDDFIAVKNGAKQANQVTPYAVWNITNQFPISTPPCYAGGMAYDPTNQLLYVTQLRADTSVQRNPLIHVFKIVQ